MATSDTITRFAVGEPGGRRSASWTVWKGKNSRDVYLGPRSLAQSLKVSLHESGVCRLAFTSQFYGRVKDSVDQPRIVDEWQRPREPLWPAIRVVFPHEGLSTVTEWPAEKEGLIWIPAPEDGRAVFVSVMFSPFTRAPGWPGRDQGFSLLGKCDLGGEIVWVIGLSGEISEGIRERINERSAVQPVPWNANLRQLLYAKEPSGRVVIEGGVGQSPSASSRSG